MSQLQNPLRCARWLLLLSLVSATTFGQGNGYNAAQTTSFTVAATGASIPEQTLILYHSLSWTTTGTVSSCTVAVDSSPDGVTWTAGGIIAGQTCTTNGVSSITAGQANFLRVNVTALGGGGSVTLVYEGWAYNPNPGGGGGSGNGNPVLPTTGMIADYQAVSQTQSGTTLIDQSGNSNNATFPGGANNPTWAAGGGLACSGAGPQYVPLPAGVINAKAVTIAYNWPTLNEGQATIQAPLIATSGQWSLWFTSYDSANNATPHLAAWNVVGNAGTTDRVSPTGIHVITYNLDTVNDTVYFDNSPVYVSGAHTQGSITSGTMWLCGGNNTGYGGARNNNAFTGTVYRAIFWNAEQSAGQAAIINNAVTTNLVNQGITIPQPYVGPDDVTVLDGDSETYNLCDILTAGVCLYNSPATTTVYNVGVNGSTTTQNLTVLQSEVYPMCPVNGRCTILEWIGTNDVGLSLTATQSYEQNLAIFRNLRARGWKILVGTMMSRTGQDAFKDALNPLLRSNWSAYADGLIDIAADPTLGCDGCNANTTYMSGGLHFTNQAGVNVVAQIHQRGLNRLYGPHDFSQGNTYTTTALAATATTAAVEVGNTITLTFAATPANCLVGNMITLAGLTPATFQTSGNNGTGQYAIVTRSATQVTLYAYATGLGTASVQGTGVCPSQQDSDTWVTIAGSAVTPNFSLETCVGYTGQNLYIKNSNTTSPWTITPFQASETIDGAASLAMPVATSGSNPVVILQALLISQAAGGCVWKRRQ